MELGLDQLREGENGVVTEIGLPAQRAAALLRLGLRRGAEIRCLRRSPFGDPAAYRFGGLTAALRKKDAGRILVRVRGRGEDGR